MNKERAKECIAIMQAYVDGKTIQEEVRDEEEGRYKWVDCVSPIFDWLHGKYRIKPLAPIWAKKPSSTYRPFKNSEELIVKYCVRFRVDKRACEVPNIWVKVKNSGDVTLIHSFTADTGEDATVLIAGEGYADMKELFNRYTFLDGSPCGVEEAEVSTCRYCMRVRHCRLNRWHI